MIAGTERQRQREEFDENWWVHVNECESAPNESMDSQEEEEEEEM